MRRITKKKKQKYIWDDDCARRYDEIIKEKEEEGEEITDAMRNGMDQGIWNEASLMADIAYEDERANLDIETEGRIIAYGTLGRWNGPVTGLLDNIGGNVKDILHHYVHGGSEIRFYSDGVDVCADEVHHDGTNHYVFRELKEGVDPYTLRLLLCKDKLDTKAASRYTKSLLPYINKVYGW